MGVQRATTVSPTITISTHLNNRHSNNTSLLGRMQPGGPPQQTSPRAVSPTPLSRFFPSEVLAAAAAAGGVRHPPKMPPLPTGQALTLEEIERHAAAAVKI